MGLWADSANNQVIDQNSLSDALNTNVFVLKSGYTKPPGGFVMVDVPSCLTKQDMINGEASIDINYPIFSNKSNNQIVIKRDLTPSASNGLTNVYVWIYSYQLWQSQDTPPKNYAYITINLSDVSASDSLSLTISVNGNDSTVISSETFSGMLNSNVGYVYMPINNNTVINSVNLISISPQSNSTQNFIVFRPTSIYIALAGDGAITINNWPTTPNVFSVTITSSANVEVNITVNVSVTVDSGGSQSTFTGSCVLAAGTSSVVFTVQVQGNNHIDNLNITGISPTTSANQSYSF